MMTSVADLNSLNIDIDVAPPDMYADSGPVLLAEGTYELALKEYELGFDRDGNFRNYIRLRRLQIVSPDELTGRYVNDLRIFTTPWTRNGVTVSGLGDFLRGIDDNATWSGLGGAKELLDKAIDLAIPVKLKLQWEAFDKAGFEQEGGPSMTRKSPEEKALRKRCTVKGMRNFPVYPDGSHKSSVAGPVSGEPIEASLNIDRTIPQSKR